MAVVEKEDLSKKSSSTSPENCLSIESSCSSPSPSAMMTAFLMTGSKMADKEEQFNEVKEEDGVASAATDKV